jgi:two-component system copper resistance phosphate regulon response regulator CusR
MARVLVVEDEERIAGFVARALRAQGFEVDLEVDGASGLHRAVGGAYDLVVLDLLLPGLDGMEVLRNVLAARPEQRVLVLSAMSDIRSKVDCLSVGAVDYMTKPFSLDELLARVWARLRAAPAGAVPRLLRLGRVTLDLERRHADGDRGSVRLSDREFALLRHLMEASGRTCSREALLEKIWGWGYDGASNVVEVYIGRLRSKLGSDAIETVRNAGYRFYAA